MSNTIELFTIEDAPSSCACDLCMIDDQLADDTKETHSEWASDAHADVQAAIDILDSLRLAGKLSCDNFQDVTYFLHSAQGWMNNMTLPEMFGQRKGVKR